MFLCIAVSLSFLIFEVFFFAKIKGAKPKTQGKILNRNKPRLITLDLSLVGIMLCDGLFNQESQICNLSCPIRGRAHTR